MRILAVDYGDVRTGIAVCDKREILASPLTTIKETYQPKLVDKISELVKSEKAEMIVVGLPRNMDGSYGYRADECKSLGEALKEATNLDVQYEDERMTTVIAHNELSANNVRGNKRKSIVDAVSAVVILQSYIDKQK